MSWLADVSWNQIAKTASTATQAAAAITQAANALGGSKNLAVDDGGGSQTKQSDNSTMLLLGLAGLLLFKKL
jgi:hypothetical protein